MNSLHVFKIQAEIFAIFWLMLSLYNVWKTRKSRDERIAEAEKAIDDLFSAVKLIPFPKILPGVFIGIWFFFAATDVIGIALLLSVIHKIDWVVKILTIVLLLTLVYGLRELVGDLHAMGEEKRFRERLLAKANLREMLVFEIESWVRFVASVILLVGVYL